MVGMGGGGRGFLALRKRLFLPPPPLCFVSLAPTVFLGPHKPPRLPLSGLSNSESDPLEYLGAGKRCQHPSCCEIPVEMGPARGGGWEPAGWRGRWARLRR